MGDHRVKWQAVEERESRSDFSWAEMWGAAFLFTLPGLNSFGVSEWGWFLWAAPPWWPFHAHFHPQCSSSPACCHHSAHTLLLGAERLCFHLYQLGLLGFFFLLLSTEWKWFAVILEWGFFHMKGKKESIYLDTHLDARRIPSRSKECCLESIIDLLWSKRSENFAKPRNVYSVLTRQGFFLWKISFALENELFHRFVSAVINMI